MSFVLRSEYIALACAIAVRLNDILRASIWTPNNTTTATTIRPCTHVCACLCIRNKSVLAATGEQKEWLKALRMMRKAQPTRLPAKPKSRIGRFFLSLLSEVR